MAIAPFLAMTAAEIRVNSVLPPKIAWMACHFSPYGLGLSNLPRELPPGALLMVDDITPIHGHDSQQILDQLAECAEAFSCSGILLDFQRPDIDETAALVDVLTQGLPCPMAVSHFYAGAGTFPVFLPPVPPSVPPEEHFALWQDRELWLELALDAVEITVTEDGSSFTPLLCVPDPVDSFREENLFCHYRITEQPDAIKFLLWRTEEDLTGLLKHAERFGVTTAVGLYQEFQSK